MVQANTSLLLSAFIQVDGRYVVKSGSDFQNASVVTLNLHNNNSLSSVDIEEITLDSSIPEDYNMKLIVSSYLGKNKLLSYSQRYS